MSENQGNRRSGGNSARRGSSNRGGFQSSGRGSKSGGKFGNRRSGGKFSGSRGQGDSNDNRRGGFKGRRDSERFNSDRRNSDGEERHFNREDRRDNKRGGYRGDSNGRNERNNRRFDRRSERRDDNRNREFNRDDRHDDRKPRNPRYNNERNGNDDRRFEGRADGRGNRSSFSNQRGNHNGRQSSANYDNPRKNSDGTLSFPSQNPYTDRRPGEPKMPKGLEWNMLSTDEKERLRGLSKEHAENIGLHMLAAYALEEDDPAAAMEHAQWVARQASRVDVSRETLAFIAYRQGNYKLALREFRTAFRMNGYGDYLPFMADCERGLGNPQKAVDIALSDDAKQLQGEPKAELFLVYAGALADLDLFDKAIEIVHTIAHAQGVGGAYRMRAVQAEQNFLELAGRQEEAEKLNDLLDRLEDKYADVDELDEDDVYVDNDLEVVDDEMLEGLGIDPREMAEYMSYHAQDSDDSDSSDIEEESAEETSLSEDSENSSESVDENDTQESNEDIADGTEIVEE
ncbi:hypothetical protein EJ419_07995 [Alloscardovia theropitheci]|uniref:Helicase n=1 Tax=Alloscardovia theropitheci TaxID=2496842 RepID=A0A4R0QN18_9BIFI|nr:hypothetical protein [Alloscardovia theropitheci]TCD53572.1 hypothetical protein EJ419_07995 [Alloscardovia theropitheci]